jgi:hypothetical protein
MRARLRGLLRKRSVEREMEEELRFHIRMRAEENLRRGMTPDEAERAALNSFGQWARIKENCREFKGGGVLETLLHDVKFGARTLAKNPGFTLAAVLTLALGTGANTAIFGVVNAILLKSLPYQEPDRIVLVWGYTPAQGLTRNQVSATDVHDWRRENKVFEDVTT